RDWAERTHTAHATARQLDPVRHVEIRLDLECRIRLVLDAGVAGSDAVDCQAVVSHLHGVARQPDHALYEPGVGCPRIEDDDITARGIRELVERDVSKGNLEVVGELVHEYPVAFDNGRFHRTRRNHVPVGQRAAENHHQDDEDGKTSVFAPSLEQTALHIRYPSCPDES